MSKSFQKVTTSQFHSGGRQEKLGAPTVSIAHAIRHQPAPRVFAGRSTSGKQRPETATKFLCQRARKQPRAENLKGNQYGWEVGRPHSKRTRRFFYSAWQRPEGPISRRPSTKRFGFYSAAVYTQQAALRSVSAILSPIRRIPFTINGVQRLTRNSPNLGDLQAARLAPGIRKLRQQPRISTVVQSYNIFFE